QADELHSYEEGINCLAQNMILDFGSPRQFERAMVTARGVEGITGINTAGHRHIRSSYYSGTKLAEDEPWNRAKPYSYLVIQPGELRVDYNGPPGVRTFTLELADGLLAHRSKGDDGHYNLPGAIVFPTDQEVGATRGSLPWHLFWGAWKWTGDRHYLDPIFDNGTGALMAVNANALDLLDARADWGARILAGERGRQTETRQADGRGSARSNSYRYSATDQFVWQLSGDKTKLERLYAAQIEECDLLEFINTEGSLWIDRVGAPTAELQRARLGGVALVRNALYPGHAVSWQFTAPAKADDVAILVPDATRTAFTVIAYNLSTAPVNAELTGWNVDPGVWEITQGLDTNDDNIADQASETRTAAFERSASVALTFPPRATTVLTFKLKTPGTPYWSRPDLGLDPEDVIIKGRDVSVTVHSLGAVPSPETSVALRDASGRVLAVEKLSSLAAPTDLQPKTATVTLHLPAGADAHGGTVEIDPEHKLGEITVRNNAVKL
ncbi:MAG: hypothetical protein JWQ62_1664, partial [Lacunisphaera sp.]|nr:hypothetical protein [Lacunisphaera sp.]